MQKISVIGLGYVGLPLAVLAAKKGYRVVGIDKDPEKIALIQKKHSPFYDKELEKSLAEVEIAATTDSSQIQGSSFIIICVPTPVSENYQPDLRPVISASENIAKYLERDQHVILESTVNPGICETVVLPILEATSGLKGGIDFELSHCPERINPGDPKWNVENIPRVVGSLTKKGVEEAYNFYSSILTGLIKKMDSLKEAEACKIVENSFRDINIAFVNELAQSFYKLGIDIVKVIDGASTKPFAFMPHYPGCGVGGHCIPVDPYYLIEYAKQNGFNHDFLSWARRINNDMPKYTVERTIEGLNQIKAAINGAKVTVLGLSYKANIGDTRESPSFEIIKHLKSHGAKVTAFDPFVPEKSTAQNFEEAIKGAKAIVLATSHDYFKEKLNTDYLINQKIKVLIDGRNILNKELFTNAGIVYIGIGR